MVAVEPAANVPVTPETVNCVTLRAEPSTSESLARTLPAMFASSAPEPVSAVPTGASWTAVMVIASLAVLVAVPPPEPRRVLRGASSWTPPRAVHPKSRRFVLPVPARQRRPHRGRAG